MPPMTHGSIIQFWYPSPACLGVLSKHRQGRFQLAWKSHVKQVHFLCLPIRANGEPKRQTTDAISGTGIHPWRKRGHWAELQNLKISSSLLICSIHTNLNYLLQSLFTFFFFHFFSHFFPFYISLKQSTLFMWQFIEGDLYKIIMF